MKNTLLSTLEALIKTTNNDQIWNIVQQAKEEKKQRKLTIRELDLIKCIAMDEMARIDYAYGR